MPRWQTDPMVRRLLLAALLLPGAAIGQVANQDSLHTYLRASNADARENWPDATYTAAFVDLNGDGRDEALVWQQAGLFCGSGGCGLYIYTPDGESWRQVDDLTIAGPPALLLGSRSLGWFDLGLIVRDGGTDLPYQVRLRFNGRSYSGSETRIRRGRHLDGRILIADGMPSRRLFP